MPRSARRAMAVLASILMVAVVAPTTPAMAAGEVIIVWADPIRAAVIQREFANGFQGATVQVVTKESLSALKTEFLASTPENGPDVIAVEQEWTGELVQARKVRSLKVPKALASKFPANVLAGYRYDERVYGIPVQFENVALITNAGLVDKPPKNFNRLMRTADALKAAGTTEVGIAVGQGSTGGYDMYPLFSGLGGYLFGTNELGNFNPLDVGVANPTFLANASRIDRWNRTGLVSSTYTRETAKAAFVAGRAPFWITGPWDLATIKKLSFRYRISSVPEIIKGTPTSAIIGSKGFMVTTHAKAHGIKPLASAFVTDGLTAKKVQTAFGQASQRLPALIASAETFPDPQLKAFGLAAASGVPWPNIPQTRSGWVPMGTAWANATKGAAATPAAAAFSEAQAQIVAAIGG
jgi:arabinogalactan oligomer/maltooligosaccharide transport system substrate-binding protein